MPPEALGNPGRGDGLEDVVFVVGIVVVVFPPRTESRLAAETVVAHTRDARRSVAMKIGVYMDVCVFIGKSVSE